MLLNFFCDHLNDRRISQHAGLKRMRADVCNNRVDLSRDEIRM